MAIRYINDIATAPKAIGPYSQATEANGVIFISGQIPLNPESGEMAQGIEAQTEQVMSNLKAILSHLGLTFGNVLKSSIFMTDLANFQTVNQIYEKWLQGVRPARATVQVAALPRNALIEIEMIATQSR